MKLFIEVALGVNLLLCLASLALLIFNRPLFWAIHDTIIYLWRN